MARDVRETGSLRQSTAIMMWLAYAAHAIGVVYALLRTDRRLPMPDAMARAVGPGAVAAGTALTISGMSMFETAGEVEGTRHDALTTRGVYRYSRNPQYLGYIVLLSGAALWRRSAAAALVTAATSGVYATWIRVEEDQLSRLYGQPYLDYLATVNRWWGRGR